MPLSLYWNDLQHDVVTMHCAWRFRLKLMSASIVVTIMQTHVTYNIWVQEKCFIWGPMWRLTQYTAIHVFQYCVLRYLGIRKHMQLYIYFFIWHWEFNYLHNCYAIVITCIFHSSYLESSHINEVWFQYEQVNRKHGLHKSGSALFLTNVST